MLTAATRQNAPLYAYDISPRQSSRLVELAVRNSAMVKLNLKTDPEIELTGIVFSAGPESLWIEPEQQGDLGDQLITVCCDGELSLGETRYLFAGSILAISRDEQHYQLEITRPDALQVIQRRRFLRADLIESTTVDLLAIDQPVDAEDALTAGILLNLSVGGIACRITTAVADQLTDGQRIGIRFELPGDPQPFYLPARVTNKTPAGSDGQMVLGLEFEITPKSPQAQRLGKALEKHL